MAKNKKTISFSLDDEQIVKLEKWQAKIKKKHGTYGMFEFRFRPTGLGLGVSVWSDTLKKELDLTDVTKW